MKIISALGLLASYAVFSGVVILLPEADVTVPTQWNEAVKSAALDRESLTALGGLLGAWKMTQMTWPSPGQVESSTVEASDEVRAECVRWLKRYLKPEYLAEDLSEHILAMKAWGMVRGQAHQKRLCDVFLVRYRRGNYVVHIQESPANVVIAVSDEKTAATETRDHKEFVKEIASKALAEVLLPGWESPSFRLKTTVARDLTVTSMSWRPEYIISRDAAGLLSVSYSKVAEIGAIAVEADTDGRFVRFDIWKQSGGTVSGYDPYKQRF